MVPKALRGPVWAKRVPQQKSEMTEQREQSQACLNYAESWRNCIGIYESWFCLTRSVQRALSWFFLSVGTERRTEKTSSRTWPGISCGKTRMRFRLGGRNEGEINNCRRQWKIEKRNINTEICRWRMLIKSAMRKMDVKEIFYSLTNNSLISLQRPFWYCIFATSIRFKYNSYEKCH